MKSAVPPPQAAPAPRQWLVLYVKSCMERKTAQRLAAMGIESYVPVQTVTRRYSDRLKKVEQLVLPWLSLSTSPPPSAVRPSPWVPLPVTWC